MATQIVAGDDILEFSGDADIDRTGALDVSAVLNAAVAAMSNSSWANAWVSARTVRKRPSKGWRRHVRGLKAVRHKPLDTPERPMARSE